MTAPSSNPRGERAGTPGTNWTIQVTTSGEVVIPDGSWDGPAVFTPWVPGGPQQASKPNRAARRAVARAARRNK